MICLLAGCCTRRDVAHACLCRRLRQQEAGIGHEPDVEDVLRASGAIQAAREVGHQRVAACTGYTRESVPGPRNIHCICCVLSRSTFLLALPPLMPERLLLTRVVSYIDHARAAAAAGLCCPLSTCYAC